MSLPVGIIVVTTSNNLLGNLAFKTLGNLLPHILDLLGSQEVR